jgi:PAS domain S-box-containing protein
MEHLFARLMRFTRDGVYRYRFDGGEILLANQAFLDILDLPGKPGDIVGRRLRDLMIYTEREGTVRRTLEEKGEIHGFEYHFLTLKGDDRWVLHDSFIVHDESSGERWVEAIVKDITERKRAERALAAEKEQLAVTLQSIGDAVVATDEQCRVTLINPVAETLTGWPATEAVGRPLSEVFHIVNEETRAPARNPLDRVMRTGRVVGLANHTALIARDGTEHSIADSAAPIRDAEGRIRGAVLVFRDVTESRRLQASLEASEEQYRLLFQEMAEGFALHEMLFDDAGKPCDYRFLAVNAAFEAQTGLKASKVVGRRVLDVIPNLEPFWIEAYGRVVTTGQAASFEHYAERLQRHYQVHAFRPRPGQFAAVFLDLTRVRQAEEDRRRLERQMQQTQKLESLGVLAGGIAHDFNNLLVGVLGNVDLALGDLPPSAPVRGYIEQIAVAARRANELCRQMLAYAGRGTIEKRAVDLNHVIRETTHLLEISVSKKAVMRFALADRLPSVLADPSQMAQIVMNLVINASEAIGERSGVIGLSTGVTECDREYLRTAFLDEKLDPGAYVYLQVADTGCGMDEATQQRIFDPFFSTKFAGRGLGLAAVLGIVRSCCGAVRVYSEPGKGTTFKLLFPVHEVVSEPRTSRRAADAGWRCSGTALLVDDEDTVRSVGRAMLERTGLKVLVASDGREALSICRQRGADLTVVLLDLTMPHMDGEETFREIRRLHPDLPVVLCSGYSERDIADRFAGKGVTAYLQKPYDGAELRERLRQALAVRPAR